MTITSQDTAEMPHDLVVSSTPPTPNVTMEPHGPHVSVNNGYGAYLPVKHKQYDTPGDANRDDCYGT